MPRKERLEWRNCIVCGSKFKIRFPSKDAKRKRVTCSTACARKNSSKITPNQLKRYRKYQCLYQRKLKEQLRDKIFLLLGNKCINCGFDNTRILQIDHINGGGSKETKRMSRLSFLKNVLRSIKSKEKKYQLLCPNCNWLKMIEKKERNRRIY